MSLFLVQLKIVPGSFDSKLAGCVESKVAVGEIRNGINLTFRNYDNNSFINLWKASQAPSGSLVVIVKVIVPVKLIKSVTKVGCA
ncbi:MAG: hypothetical protein CM15mP58_18490 [Burkholderiaceae bacterium]|nr:MAG: hypothetical protein CM15mP58_18490 [Burkholderiaceae bacterium]